MLAIVAASDASQPALPVEWDELSLTADLVARIRSGVWAPFG